MPKQGEPGHVDVVQVIDKDGRVSTTKLMTVGVVQQPPAIATRPVPQPIEVAVDLPESGE